MSFNGFSVLVFALTVVFCLGLLLGSLLEGKTHNSNYAKGIYKIYSWSDVKDLNAELAKGYRIIETYDVTNMVLKKVENK